MTAEQFAYWLQGFNEINGTVPTEAQWAVIKDHLATVFTKVTPNRINLTPEDWSKFMAQPMYPKLDTTVIC